MKEWLRLSGDRQCGLCSRSIQAGEPLLLIGPFRKPRCSACAGERVPDDIGPAIERPRQAAPLLMTRFSAGMLPLDWKSRALEAGDREPGEEG